MNKLTEVQKKWLLTIHLLFAAVMLGSTVGFLIVTITAYNTNDIEIMKVSYSIMHILAKTSLRLSTIGAIVSGVLLAILTKWGLLRFYWIIAKQILSIIAIGIGVVGIYFWSLKGISILEGTNSNIDPTFVINNIQLLTGIILQIISLVAIFIISIFKPWGERRKVRKM